MPMNPKQIAWGLGILAALAVVFGVWASYTAKPVEQSLTETRVLQGELTATGDYAYREESEYYVITASYPAKTPLKGAADQQARLVVEQGLADQMASFKRDSGLESITAQDAQFQGISGDRKYALDMQYKEYRSPVTISYAYTVYVDTLGAHPNGYFKTFVFDGDGVEVMLEDLFVEGSEYLDRLSQAAAAQVTGELRARTGSEDIAGSVYAEGLAGKKENFQNFYIDRDTLVILIPPYQVAAYAAGSFEVRIPLSELSDILVSAVARS